MRAEEDRQAGVARRLEATEEIAGRRADALTCVVLAHVQPEAAQVLGYAVGDGALLARWARQRGELREEVDDARHRARS